MLGAILVLSVTLYQNPADSSVPPPMLTERPTQTPVQSPLPTIPTASPTARSSPRPTAIPIGPAVGQQAPAFTLLDLDGNAHNLRDYRGQVVLVTFWASWCPACQREWPELQSLAERYAPRGVVLLAVNVEEPPEVVGRFVGDEALPLSVLLDGNGHVSEDYRVTALPTTFLLHRDGVVSQVIPGHVDEAPLERLLQAGAAED
jgi:peroxiredoxin